MVFVKKLEKISQFLVKHNSDEAGGLKTLKFMVKQYFCYSLSLHKSTEDGVKFISSFLLNCNFFHLLNYKFKSHFIVWKLFTVVIYSLNICCPLPPDGHSQPSRSFFFIKVKYRWQCLNFFVKTLIWFNGLGLLISFLIASILFE